MSDPQIILSGGRITNVAPGEASGDVATVGQTGLAQYGDGSDGDVTISATDEAGGVIFLMTRSLPNTITITAPGGAGGSGGSGTGVGGLNGAAGDDGIVVVIHD